MNITTWNEVPEAVALRFKDIYESAEWKKLDPVDRAQLLLVAEWVKPGTIIWGDFTYMPNILEKLGLVSSLNTDPLELGPVYMVWTEKSLTTFHRWTIIDTPETNKPWYYHYLNWEFLWYPTCCTDEYCCPSKNLAARKKQSPHKFLSNVDFEVSELIEKTGTYPEELDFCPPSFTPCGANCDCASPILKRV
jgi:hypothetical protein